jgi:hypothetical protein
MQLSTVHISTKGRLVEVPSVRIADRDVIISGKWIRSAFIFEEDWLETEPVPNPAVFTDSLKHLPSIPDYFTFSQRFTAPKPRFPFPFEWDNIAAIPINTFEEWWEKRVSHDLRKDVKRSEKRGVTVQVAEFDDEFVHGIQAIYNETPFRQGRRFWHYGKNLDAVRRENATFQSRSQFLGAYFEGSLIGFIKIVHAGDVARMMQIISYEKHQDKRPGNALIAKAVELCAAQGSSYLTYGKFTYDNKRRSSVVQYKRRNGFEEILFPRYYVPLTVRGAWAIRTGMHLSWRRFIPESVTNLLLRTRAALQGASRPAAEAQDGPAQEKALPSQP